MRNFLIFIIGMGAGYTFGMLFAYHTFYEFIMSEAPDDDYIFTEEDNE